MHPHTADSPKSTSEPTFWLEPDPIVAVLISTKVGPLRHHLPTGNHHGRQERIHNGASSAVEKKACA